MRSEPELVPYAPGELPGEPLLVLAPHPDDEVFGCGGLLALAARQRRRIAVAVLTGGDAQGEPQVRREESREAARRLGTPEPEFLAFADRGLDPADPALAAAIRDLLARHRPQVVLVPAPSEVHPDHRALALATYRTVQEAPEPDPDLRLAAYEVSAVLRPNLLLDVSSVWEDVLAAAKAFTSQLGAAPYLEALEGIASARRLTLPPSVRRAEAYHVVDLAFVRTHSALEWAARLGPSSGLEVPPSVAPPDAVLLHDGDGPWLLEALAALAAEEPPPGTVVVAGQPPPDPLPPEVARLAAAVVTGPPCGATLARALRRAGSSHAVVYRQGELPLPGAILALGRALARGAALAAGAAVMVVEGERVLRPAPAGPGLAAALAAGTLPAGAAAVPRQALLEALTHHPGRGVREALARVALALPPVTIAEPVCRAPASPRPHEPPGELVRLVGSLEPEAAAAAVASLAAEAAARGEEASRLARGLATAAAERDRLRGELERLRGELAAARQEAGEADALRERVAALEQELRTAREPDPPRGVRGLLRRRG